jgi:hypothetical protein
MKEGDCRWQPNPPATVESWQHAAGLFELRRPDRLPERRVGHGRALAALQGRDNGLVKPAAIAATALAGLEVDFDK